MRNQREYLLWLYTAWWAGLTVVPVNAKLHSGRALALEEDPLGCAPPMSGSNIQWAQVQVVEVIGGVALQF